MSASAAAAAAKRPKRGPRPPPAAPPSSQPHTAVVCMTSWYRHYPERLRPALPLGTLFFNGEKRDFWPRLGGLLRSGQVRTLVVIAYGSGGADKDEKPFTAMKSELTNWVRNGGVLLLHGERWVKQVFQEWFGLAHWDQKMYRRLTHTLNAGQNAAVQAHPLLKQQMSDGVVPATISVKSCMMSGVRASEALYWCCEEPRSDEFHACCFALVGVARGHVAFFGDVNAEPPTIDTIKLLAKYLPSSQPEVAAALPAAAALISPPGGMPVPMQDEGERGRAQEAQGSAAPGASASSDPAAAASSSSASAKSTETLYRCSYCYNQLNPRQFSYNQLGKGASRRCKECVAVILQKEVAERRLASRQPGDSYEGQGEDSSNSYDDYDDDESDESEGSQLDSDFADEQRFSMYGDFGEYHGDKQDEGDQSAGSSGAHEREWDRKPCPFDREHGVSTQGVGLCNSVAFPLWSNVTDENDPSLVYYTDPMVTGTFAPRRHWTVLGEITDSRMAGMGFGRNMLVLRDRAGEQYCAAFYTDEPINHRPLLGSEGHVLAVRYGEQHGFMDGTTGMRIEDVKYTKVIPCSLQQLYKLYALTVAKKNVPPACWKCGKQAASSAQPAAAAAAGAGAGAAAAGAGTALAFPPAASAAGLSRCANCRQAYYCSRECQAGDWKAAHSAQCKPLQHLADLLDEGAQVWQGKTHPFKMANLKK